METCLIGIASLLVVSLVAYRYEKRRWQKLYLACNASRGEALDFANECSRERSAAEQRLEKCRKSLRKTIRQRAAARGRVTKLKHRVAELEGGVE